MKVLFDKHSWLSNFIQLYLLSLYTGMDRFKFTFLAYKTLSDTFRPHLCFQVNYNA